MDMDLRKPTLHNKFMEDNSSGLSNLMVNNISIDDVIHKTSFENLFFVPAGPIIPNPSELIEAGVLDDLIAKLRTRYDYVVIDSSPMGLVADASILMKYASQILLITRNNFTRKDILINALELLKSNNFDNYDIVYNDINFKKSPYGNYSHYYT